MYAFLFPDSHNKLVVVVVVVVVTTHDATSFTAEIWNNKLTITKGESGGKEERG